MRKLIILIVCIILGGVVYNYIYQDHRNIEEETAIFEVTSTIISQEFTQNPTEAEKKYLNKTVEVLGLITELNTKDLTLDNTVFCQFKNIIKQSLKLDSKLKIKGRIIGYDDLLEQVKIDQCNIIKNP